MAKVPLPERGQPLDVTYLYQLAEAVNDLSTQVSSATYNYTSIDTVSSGQQNVKTSETRMVGAYKEIYNNAIVTAGQETENFVSFSNFKYPPIVTATIVNIAGTSAGSDASVILKSISQGRVDFVVRFGTSGTTTVGVNIIAIGIPN
jgi:hypothetical protein